MSCEFKSSSETVSPSALAHPVRLPARPIPARFTPRPDGSTALSVVLGDKAILVENGAGYARIVQRHDRTLREVWYAPAASSAAHVYTEIEVVGRSVTRKRRTNFINGTVRTDWLAYDGETLTRHAQWEFRDKQVARAEYSTEGRSLEYLNGAGDIIGRFETAIRPNPTGFTSRTEQLLSGDGGPVVIGSKTVHPGSSTTVIGRTIVGLPGHETSGPMSYSTVTQALDGTTTLTQVIPEADSRGFTGGAVSYAVVAPDGTFTSSTQLSGMDRNGQSFIGTNNQSVGSDGTVTNSNGVVGTTSDGGFYSVTETHSSDGSSQRSSFASDSQGNSSQTTVTYGSDGSFTISTVSTDSDGNVTSQDSSFDKDGNRTSPGGGNQGGDGGGGDGGGGGGGDGAPPPTTGAAAEVTGAAKTEAAAATTGAAAEVTGAAAEVTGAATTGAAETEAAVRAPFPPTMGPTPRRAPIGAGRSTIRSRPGSITHSALWAVRTPPLRRLVI